jgi:hypothetical protein
MSQIKVNAVTDASGGNTATINSMTPTADSLQGFRNRIINGAFQIWQRGTTISSIPATGTTVTYAADRWCFQPANTGWTAIAQAVQISGGGLRVNCTTAAAYATTADVLSVQQRIEGFNCYDLAGQQITVSFKVKTNKTGNYGVVLFDGTAAAFGTPQSITVATSEVETTYTLTFSAPASITADNADRLRLIFTLGANTARAGSYYPTGGSQVNLLDNISNYFEIDDVQLEKGSTATPFERRDYGRELAMCQRYYQKVEAQATFAGRGFSSTEVLLGIPLNVSLRASPTLSDGGTTFLYSGGARVNSTGGTLTVTSYDTETTNIAAVRGGFTITDDRIYNAIFSSNVTISAEL